MSKRFGRNQRRKMRKRIEHLESDNRLKSTLMQRNQRIVEDVARILGRYFVGLDPEFQEIKYIDQMFPGWRAMVKRDHFNPGPIPMGEFVEMILPVLRGSRFIDDLRQQMHIRFVYDGTEVGYALDRQALLNMPRDLAIRNLAEAMARQLADSLNRPDREVAA